MVDGRHEESPPVLYVSPLGRDTWSGALPEPNSAGTDGPLHTIDRARALVREQKQIGALMAPVMVFLRGGRYALTTPLAFSPGDSGPITYAAYPGEQPIFDGGERIHGWRVEQHGGTTVWIADLPEVAAGTWYFHQLWVNGQRRRRPRLPKEGFYWMERVPGMTLVEGRFVDQLFDGSSSFVCALGDIQQWRNLTDVEVLVPHFRVEERMPIASFDQQTRTLTSTHRSIFALRDDVAVRYARYMEGIYTLGVQPGTVLRGNVIYNVEKHNYGGWAIYLDEGSSHILVEANICYNTSSQVFNQHYGRENIIRNNIFAFGREGLISLGRAEDHNSFSFECNVVIARGRPFFVAGYAGQLEKRGFRSDLNLFWDIESAPWSAANGQTDAEGHWSAARAFTLEEWQALGNDRHAIAADPGCRDLAHEQFELQETSPAFALGFQAIDTRAVGPRPPGTRQQDRAR
jgi:hypothetical protein